MCISILAATQRHYRPIRITSVLNREPILTTAHQTRTAIRIALRQNPTPDSGDPPESHPDSRRPRPVLNSHQQGVPS